MEVRENQCQISQIYILHMNFSICQTEARRAETIFFGDQEPPPPRSEYNF